MFARRTLTGSDVSLPSIGNAATEFPRSLLLERPARRARPECVRRHRHAAISAIENLTETASQHIDDTMSLGISYVESLGESAVAVAPGLETWQVMSEFLSTYYSNEGWVGDRDGVYPQFDAKAVDAGQEMYGNSRRLVTLQWMPTDWLFGLVDRGYLTVAVKLPILNWSSSQSPIYFLGQVKVHDAFDVPFVTILSTSVSYPQATSAE